MYNEKQKREYIDCYKGTSVETLERYFERIAISERMLDKDIADMDVEEIKATLMSLSIRSVTSRGHLISMMRAYVNWCVHEGKSINNNLVNIKPANLEPKSAITTKMLRSPGQLRYILDTVYNPDVYSMPNRAERNKLVFWLLYSGLKIKELQYLRKTDVNYEKKIVRSPTNKSIHYYVDDEIIDLWKRCVTHTHLEKGGVYNEGDIYYLELVNNDFLFSSVKGKNTDNENVDEKMCSVSSFASIVNGTFRDYNERTSEYIGISPMNLKISGAFYKVYLEEKKGEMLTPNLMSCHLNLTYPCEEELKKAMRKYIIDYKEWKESFNYNE